MSPVSRVAGLVILLLLASTTVVAQSPTAGTQTVGSYTLGWYYSLAPASQGPVLMTMLNTLVNLGLRCREQVDMGTVLSLGLGLSKARTVSDWQSANLMGVTLIYLAKAEGCAFDRNRLGEVVTTTDRLRE